MAYTKQLDTKCDAGMCIKRATHEVYNRVNERIGQFCRPHADRKTADLNAGRA